MIKKHLVCCVALITALCNQEFVSGQQKKIISIESVRHPLFGHHKPSDQANIQYKNSDPIDVVLLPEPVTEVGWASRENLCIIAGDVYLCKKPDEQSLGQPVKIVDMKGSFLGYGAATPDKSKMVCCTRRGVDNPSVFVIDIETQKVVASLKINVGKKRFLWPNSLYQDSLFAFAASEGASSGSIRIYDVKSSKFVAEKDLTDGGYVNSLSWSDDGNNLYAAVPIDAAQNNLFRYDLKMAKLDVLDIHKKGVWAAAISPCENPTLLLGISGCRDYHDTLVACNKNASDQKRITTKGLPRVISWNAAGSCAAVGYDEGLVDMYSRKQGTLSFVADNLVGSLFSLLFSNNEQYVAASTLAGHSVVVDISTGEQVIESKSPDVTTSMAFNEDDSYWAAGSLDKSVVVCHVPKKPVAQKMMHSFVMVDNDMSKNGDDYQSEKQGDFIHIQSMNKELPKNNDSSKTCLVS